MRDEITTDDSVLPDFTVHGGPIPNRRHHAAIEVQVMNIDIDALQAIRDAGATCPFKHSLTANEFDAPAIDKAKRHKKPKTVDSSSKSTDSAESTSSGDAHGHLPDREISLIERWNDEIPMKTSPAITASDDQETAVQAYLRAKALLLEKVSAKKGKTPSTPARCTCPCLLKDMKGMGPACFCSNGSHLSCDLPGLTNGDYPFLPRPNRRRSSTKD
ncbi:hypothetical protein LTR35_002717 [Friedmanniomyces endolithicus]|nr:hypothetical protein LTS00_009982 [Friedmanniomyces endolithicus]KAK0289520.1 hypothetical protein LTR35_002717 [Friedmanniomyces endolithicus]KAK1019599.1 hypothetical protein LTR54_000241 [Friedmanniomyces endolithicus]